MEDWFCNETMVQGKIPIQLDLYISEKVTEDWFCNKTAVQLSK